MIHRMTTMMIPPPNFASLKCPKQRKFTVLTVVYDNHKDNPTFMFIGPCIIAIVDE